MTTKPKTVREYLNQLIWDGRERFAYWLEDCASRLRPVEQPCDAEHLIEPGQRHAMLKSLAASMRFRGAIYTEIEAVLLLANKSRCVPPKSEGEVKAIARWAADQPSAPLHDSSVGGQHAEAAVIFADDPLVDMLHRALGNRTGKLRVADAFLICGLEAGKVNQDQIDRFSRAIRELGWERARRPRNGALEYAYVKGTAAEREVALVVEYDPHMRSVRIEVDTGGRTSAKN